MAEETCDEAKGVSESSNSYQLHTLFDREIFSSSTKGIRIANCLRPKAGDNYSYEESGVLDKIQDLAVSDTLMCSFCCINFDDQIRQRQHYKLDWHRYNLKQNLEGKKPVTEEKFDQLADDVSSISGSDTEEEDQFVDYGQPISDDTPLPKSESNSSNLLSDLHLRQPKIFFENEDGNIISLYKSVLYGKKDVPENEKELISLALECQTNPYWAVVMLGGGHFAAAIFEGVDPVVHKTFHCYTVRANQGGAQGSRDSKSATSHPKSAGASLRRYNEASLIQHVQEIMQSWSDQLSKCSRIFWRAAGPHNQSVLFGGKTPPLAKADLRLRSIPFPTRRPTFFEVQRVHKTLSSLEIYGKAENYIDKFPVSPRSNIGRRERKPYNSAPIEANEGAENGKGVPPPPLGAATSKAQSPRKSSGGRVIDRAKPRRSPSRPLPEMVQALAMAESPGGSSEEDDEGKRHYEIIVPTLESFENHELGDGVSPEVKDAILEAKRCSKKAGGKKKKKKAVPAPQPMKRKDEGAEVELDESMVKLAMDIRAACESGDVDLLQLYISSAAESNLGQSVNGFHQRESTEGVTVGVDNGDVSIMQKIQGYIFEDGHSVLHAASAHGDPVILRALLEAGFDPSVKNKKGQPPYAVSAHKEMRNTFRRFMADFSDRYDYAKAQVPGPMTEELENRVLEKKKLARKAKKEKEKTKRKDEEERAERERFLSLSEREKRALAAERRLLERSRKGQGKPVVISRCYHCAVDITGKVPFEYDANRFCTIDCLKLHRAESKPAS